MSMKWCNVFPDVPEKFHERLACALDSLENQNDKKSKTRKVYIMKKKLIAAVAAAVILLGALTVSAVTGLPEFVLNMFGNNQAVLDGLQSDVKYKVLRNTFDGLTFEVSALYADKDAVFLAIDVVSDEPIFTENDDGASTVMFNPLVLGKNDFTSISTRNYFINEYRLTILAYFSEPHSGEVKPGNEYTAAFSNFSFFSQEDYGMVEIKFTIDELAMGNDVHVFPNTPTADGNTISEIKINPFRIMIIFENINLFAASEDYKLNHLDVAFKMANGEIINSENIIQSASSGGHTKNAAGEITDGDASLSINFKFDSTFDVNDIEAVIYKGIEIPLK